MRQTLAVGWFPEEEWARALDRWPELGDEMPRDHTGYRRAIERRMKEITANGKGARFVMVALTVDAIDERAAAEGVDASDGDVRGRTASLLAQSGLGVPWPPGRNDRCWCVASTDVNYPKYKQCCGERAVYDHSAASSPEGGPSGDT